MERAQLRAQQRGIVVNAVIAAVFSGSVLTAGYLILPHYFSFPITVSERLAFAFQLSVFVFLWVVIAVRMVSRVRFYSPEDMKGSAYTVPSEKIAVPRAFLQNTLEQAVIAVGALVALATLFTGTALAFLPGIVLLFSIGRITFLWGYPKGAAARAFGMVTTVLPPLVGYLVAVYLMLVNLF